MTVEVQLDRLTQYIEETRSTYEKKLKEWVDTPSVSMDPAHKKDILEQAEKAKQLLTQLGAHAEIIETKGNPVVTGEFKSSPDHPTVLVYNHLDVQPADASEWKNPPFTMATEGDKYLGRGTTDDKGPALAVLYAAKYAHDNKIPLNIKFCWELEEEIGSPSFHEFLKKNADSLKADSIVISDTVWVSKEKPAIPYGLRGLQAGLIKLQTGAKDVHSGEVGGLARNPITEMTKLISECVDATTGEVKIPGFYDDVRKESDEELEGFVKSGFSIDHFKTAHELRSLRTDNDKEGAARIWTRPTFEVHGITGGYSGPGVKTIVPYRAEAKISMRLVPDQDPDKIIELLKKFVKERCPDAEVEKQGTLKPYLGDFKGKFPTAAKEAMKLAFNKEAAFIREGGSIGAVVSMKELLGLPIVFLGLSLPEHGYHAINENFDWGQASGGIKLFVHYFKLLSDL
jgi:Acetylornithine deacetylase/Succinyl-diaminopimelate desuccinylase and related deacylases